MHDVCFVCVRVSSLLCGCITFSLCVIMRSSFFSSGGMLVMCAVMLIGLVVQVNALPVSSAQSATNMRLSKLTGEGNDAAVSLSEFSSTQTSSDVPQISPDDLCGVCSQPLLPETPEKVTLVTLADATGKLSCVETKKRDNYDLFTLFPHTLHKKCAERIMALPPSDPQASKCPVCAHKFSQLTEVYKSTSTPTALQRVGAWIGDKKRSYSSWMQNRQFQRASKQRDLSLRKLEAAFSREVKSIIQSEKLSPYFFKNSGDIIRAINEKPNPKETLPMLEFLASRKEKLQRVLPRVQEVERKYIMKTEAVEKSVNSGNAGETNAPSPQSSRQRTMTTVDVPLPNQVPNSPPQSPTPVNPGATLKRQRAMTTIY